MNRPNPDNPLDDFSKTELSEIECYFWASFLGLLVVGHLVPYFPRYALPHPDYGNVMHVLNFLKEPGLFAGDRLTQLVGKFSTTTAPVYFFGIAHPLNLLLPTKWVLFVIGAFITGLATFFAGDNWKTRTNLVIAVLTLFVLLHVTVSPLEGNRRSFTAVFLLAALWLEDHGSFTGKILVTAIAAGVYPPAALLIMTYFGLRNTEAFYRGSKPFSGVLFRVGALTVTFLLVVSPYLFELFSPGGTTNFSGEIINLEGTSNFSRISMPLRYNLDSINEFIQTFIVGIEGQVYTRGALFRDQLNFDFFLAMLTVLIMECMILGRDFQLKGRYVFLAIASLALWGLAHLVHPLIYHPFKYTRVSLLLAALLPFAENLPPMASVIRRKFSQLKGLRLMFLLLGVWILGIWSLVVVFPSKFSFLRVFGLVGLNWWKFVFSLPIFFVLLIGVPQSWKNPEYRGLVAGLILLTLMLLPHPVTSIQFNGLTLDDLGGLYETVGHSPPGTKVAGPPVFHMDFIPAFSKRGVYSSGNLTMIDSVCDRNRKFWNIYFSESSRKILSFMRQNDIDYLLVDRTILREKTPYGSLRCKITVDMPENPYLNRTFSDAPWRRNNRLYLITPKSLKPVPKITDDKSNSSE